MRLHREVLAVLTGEIVAGRPPAGALLPRETDLAERFDVSRGVARECIRALEERGLVKVRHGRGATVASRDGWDVFNADVLLAVLRGPLAVELLGEYLECRRLLDVAAAGFAATRATEPQRSALKVALDRMEEATARPRAGNAEEEFHRADVSFHETLADATGNRALGSLSRRIHDALVIARYPLARPQYRARRAMPEHRRIFEAVTAGDGAGAQRAMEEHLRTVEEYLHQHARRIAAAA